MVALNNKDEFKKEENSLPHLLINDYMIFENKFSKMKVKLSFLKLCILAKLLLKTRLWDNI